MCSGCFCSYLIDGLFDLWFLSFSTSKDEVSSQSANNLQLLPQAVCLCFDGLKTHRTHTVKLKTCRENRFIYIMLLISYFCKVHYINHCFLF